MKALSIPKGLGIGSRAQLVILSVLLVLSLLLTMGSFAYVTIKAGHDEQYIAQAAEQRVLSQSIARHAGEAVALREDAAFERLHNDRDRFAVALRHLREGRQEMGLPASPQSLQARLLTCLYRTDTSSSSGRLRDHSWM